jgi:hypothetical protein
MDIPARDIAVIKQALIGIAFVLMVIAALLAR